jgi:hypothetical protein
MSTLQEIETAVQRLTPLELATFRDWFAEFDALIWDQQIEADAKAGRLDQLAQEALREHREGRTTEL